ncbi:hypothetical protein [Nocardia amamiensis]|uniref:hypothetical protein n=1 Tax=Nocardia amamiensis TaxID=404578 RepID=UPI0012F51AE7|nr:hypothetical protein [Nocardia amamiensis]
MSGCGGGVWSRFGERGELEGDRVGDRGGFDEVDRIVVAGVFVVEDGFAEPDPLLDSFHPG